MGIHLLATGKALPEKRVTNHDMEKIVETSDEWIVERTGIQARYINTKENTLTLSRQAVIRAFGTISADESAWEDIKDSIDLVIVATVTPDQLVPSMSAKVKKELGLKNAIAFDINAACSGFIYGTWIAKSMMESNGYINRALVIGAEQLSKITNWEDRNTCVLFGDGAGAAIYERREDKTGILDCVIKNYDDKDDALTCGMGYGKNPFAEASSPALVSMHGTKVFKFAVTAIDDVITSLLDKTGKSMDDIKFIVPHQANLRIISNVAQKFGKPLGKFQVNIQETGNTSAASVPMALDDLARSKKVSEGDLILIVGFGGGLSAGAILLEV